MNEAITIVGLQWGDEGKGKIVDWLSGQAKHVARFQGGHNAGHSLVYKGRKTVLHLLPSGVLHENTDCYIGSGVVVSLAALLEEINDLRQAGIMLTGRLHVATNAALLLPYHQRLDLARERKNKIGTTGLGIGPAHEDKMGRRALRLYDLYNGCGADKFAENLQFYNDLLAQHGEAADKDSAMLWEELQLQGEQLRPYLCEDIGCRLLHAKKRGEKILLEGAQGALLDVEHGTYPYVTSASCLATAAVSGLGVDLQSCTVGITKSYCTRVGNGPFPTELHDEVGKILAEAGKEFGSTTGRARRVGWLDIPMLRHAVRINGCRQLIVTKLDILDELESIKVCTAYELDGKQLMLPPADPTRLERCKPVYQTLPGWKGQQTADMTDDAKLPAAAREYLQLIEEYCEIPIAVISTGAERASTITRRGVF